jgi:hypothetical protein
MHLESRQKPGISRKGTGGLAQKVGFALGQKILPALPSISWEWGVTQSDPSTG